MSKMHILFSKLGALASGSLIVLCSWTYSATAEQYSKNPSPETNPGLSPGSFPKACAPGFKQVPEGADFYSCEMVGSTKPVCLSKLWLESKLIIEKSGKNGWKIGYACSKNPN